MFSSVVVCLSLFVSQRVEAFEFDSGVGGRELPFGSEGLFVAGRLPGCDRRFHRCGTLKAAADTLPGEDAQFHFSHVQPTAVAGGVNEAKLRRAGSCLPTFATELTASSVRFDR